MVKNVYNDIFDNSKRKAWIRDHLECSETKEYENYFVKFLQGYLLKSWTFFKIFS